MTQNLFLLGEDLQDGFSLLAGRALEVRVDDLAGQMGRHRDDHLPALDGRAVGEAVCPDRTLKIVPRRGRRSRSPPES